MAMGAAMSDRTIRGLSDELLLAEQALATERTAREAAEAELARLRAGIERLVVDSEKAASNEVRSTATRRAFNWLAYELRGLLGSEGET